MHVHLICRPPVLTLGLNILLTSVGGGKTGIPLAAPQALRKRPEPQCMDWPASKLIELTRKKNDHDKPQRFQDGTKSF